MGPYPGIASRVLNFDKRERMNENPWATNEACDGMHPPRSAAADGRLFSAGTSEEPIAPGGWAEAALKLRAGSSDSDAAIWNL